MGLSYPWCDYYHKNYFEKPNCHKYPTTETTLEKLNKKSLR